MGVRQGRLNRTNVVTLGQCVAFLPFVSGESCSPALVLEFGQEGIQSQTHATKHLIAFKVEVHSRWGSRWAQSWLLHGGSGLTGFIDLHEL